MQAIETGIFRIAPATYLRVVAGTSLPSLLATVILFSFVAVVAGVLFDLRIILVALILIFLVFPFYIYHIYFTRLLTVEAQAAVRPKSVLIEPGIAITERFHSVEETMDTPKPCVRQWDHIDHVKADRRNLIIYFSDQSVPLIIPIDSLPADAVIASLLEKFPDKASGE